MRFKGNFRDLKNYGYKFWKAYARNYKLYTKESERYGKDINIWVAGREVEFDDLGKRSYLIFDKVKEGCVIEDTRSMLVRVQGKLMTVGPYVKIAINKKLECVEEYDIYKHNDIHLIRDVLEDKDKVQRILKEYYETYKIYTISEAH